jgi:divalent metal cation (Fe/Co/Zn/Cd) transporter
VPRELETPACRSARVHHDADSAGVVTTELAVAPAPLAPSGKTRAQLVRRAKQLSWLSLGWMTIEGGVAISAGLVAGSVALVGFGIDSAIEGLASVIVIWRFTGSRTFSEDAERRAQKLVAISFFMLAPYIAQDAVRALAAGDHPGTSWVGVGLSVGSILLMPLLGRAKQRVGSALGSAATAGEGSQNLLCAYLAAGVLVGLLANTLLGLWWLDPVVALGIAAVAVKEGRETWRGDGCCEDGLMPLAADPRDDRC